MLAALGVLAFAACGEDAVDSLRPSRAEDAARSECDLDVELTAVVLDEDDESVLYDLDGPDGVARATVIVDADGDVLSVVCSDFSRATPDTASTP